jgi:hypothetical protein
MRFLGWILVTFAIGFSLSTVWLGDLLTSKQWVYLMQVPGHKWTWGIWFLAAGLMLAYGLRRKRHGYAATGSFSMGVASLTIGAFYVLGPLFESSLLTLGYWTWFLNAALMFYLFAIFVTESTW